MKKTAVCAVIYIFSFSGLLYAFGESTDEQKKDRFIAAHGDLSVTGVEVRGLSRTRDSIVLREIPVTEGMPLSSFSPDDAVQELRKLNLFHAVSIDYEPNERGVHVVAHLKEKWTLIPIPAIKFAGDYQSYGAFITESNFLGLKKTLYGGGAWSPTNGWRAQFGYIDPALSGSRFTMSMMALVGDELFENHSGDGELIQRFNAFHLKGEITAGYKIYKNHTLSLLTMYRQGDTVSVSSPLEEPPSVKVLYQGTRYTFRNLNFQKVFTFGWRVVLDYSRGIALNGNASGHNQSRLVAAYSFPLFSSHRMTLLARGGAGKLPAVFEERIAGTPGFKTLKANEVSADFFIAGVVTWEYPLWSHSLVTVAAAASWEQGAFKKDDMPAENAFGPGAGLRLYLKKVTIPAVGLDVVYSIPQKETRFSFSMGVAM